MPNEMIALGTLPDDLKEFLVSVGSNMIGAKQAVFKFPNGYGASIIHGFGTYGLELAVLKGDDLDMTTPVADDVVGYLEPHELIVLLYQIKALPGVPGTPSIIEGEIKK